MKYPAGGSPTRSPAGGTDYRQVPLRAGKPRRRYRLARDSYRKMERLYRQRIDARRASF